MRLGKSLEAENWTFGFLFILLIVAGFFSIIALVLRGIFVSLGVYP